MNWDNLLKEVKKKAREGDEKCLQFLELFEDLPHDLRQKAMKCAIEINVYYGKHGNITEKKLLEIGEKWGIKNLLEDEIFMIQVQKFTNLGKESEEADLA